MINFSSYSSIEANLFVRLDITDYKVLTFSDYPIPYTINGEQYTGLGQLLNVGNTDSNLRATPQDLSITISGILQSNISDVLNYKIKGSNIILYRAFFDPNTNELLTISGNPASKFNGVVSNFDISDDLVMESEEGTVSINFICTSVVELLNNKIVGRRTNPIDQRLYYPNDPSMDRVPNLSKSNFNFGAPI